MISDEERQQVLDVVRRAEAAPVGLEERLAAVEDRLAIEALFHRYGYLEDFGRWEELVDLYTDDVERILGGTLRQHIKGKAARLEEYARPSLPGKDGRQGDVGASDRQQLEIKHLITGIVVNVQGDEASAVARYIISAQATVGGEHRRGMHDGSYEFRFRRTPDGWRICRMLVISGNAQNPMFTPKEP